MSGKLNVHVKLIFPLFFGLCLGVILLLGLQSSSATTSGSPAEGYRIEVVPDDMTLAGEVTTLSNCSHPTVRLWFEGTPTGTIMLGVDPASPYTDDWDGGSATAEIFLRDIYSPTLLVVRLSWPDRDGKGLHSPERNRMATISLDGRPLWNKRTTHVSTFNDYYGAEHQPILTTIVLTQSITHTLTISVPARTAWDLSQIELTAYPYPTTTRGIGYSPFRDCQYPGGVLQPSIQDLKEDLFRLFHTSNAIRTYSATGINSQVPILANEIGLPVFAGAWIDGNEQDDDEVQSLCNLACEAELEGVIVGNEYYLRHRTVTDTHYLLQRIREVKQCIFDACGKVVPVTTAEIDNLMFGWESDSSAFITGIHPIYRPILDEVDFVMVHTYPFWNRMSIDGAAAFTVNRYKAMQDLIQQEYPNQNKWVIIGEAGWPSAGAPNGAAVPSEGNQRRYMIEFLYLAERENVHFMYFDAFDELWKIEEPGRVGQHWGYSCTDRAAKYSFYGVLLPTDEILFNKVYLPCVLGQADGSASYASLSRPYMMPQHSETALSDPIRVTSDITFPVFTEWPMGPGKQFVPSGWMGDIGQLDVYECDRTDPHGGEMAARISYSPIGSLGWAGIYWQYPENNWGNISATIDLSYTNKLTFWAKGKEGGEKIRFFVGGIGTEDDPYPESLRPAESTGFIELGDTWNVYTINLRGKDLTRVIGGFGWAADQCANPDGATFYLDDIVFEHDPDLPAPPIPGPIFPVYTDAAAQDNHYIPSGWMGDGEVPGRMSLTECWDDDPHSPDTSIRVAYTDVVSGWAGIYWLHPADNWGDGPGGYNLSRTNKLTFWARGENGGERIRFFVGGIGTENDPYPDLLRPEESTGFIELGDTWQVYTINLRGKDLTRVVGGFGWATDQCASPDGVTFYLDDIVYEYDPNLPEPPPPGPVFPVYTDAAAQDNHYFPTGWMGDTGDIRLDECCTTDPHAGTTVISAAYTAEGSGPHYGCDGPTPCDWGGVYWQHPAHNWGDRPGGHILTGARALTFWAKGEEGGEWVSFKAGGIGCGSATYPDSLCPVQTIDPCPIDLTNTWQVYTIRLSADLDLSGVVGGFLWAASGEDNPDGATFYLDDIRYLFGVDVPLQPHWIYYGPMLACGYDMGVNTSGGRTDWVRDMDGYMCMDYPSGQRWGAVFITVGSPRPFPRPGKDLSSYQTLSLELRGETGGEYVWIGLKDNTDPDNGRETKILVDDLTTDWQPYTFDLSNFRTAALTRLYVVTEFVFEDGTPAETVCFRRIQYLP